MPRIDEAIIAILGDDDFMAERSALELTDDAFRSERHLSLDAGCHLFQGGSPRGKFRFSYDQSISAGKFVCAAHLAFHALSFIVEFDRYSGTLQFAGETESALFCLFAEGDDKECRSSGEFCSIEQQGNSLDTHCKADSRDRWPAEIGNQPVVSSPRGDGTLRSEQSGNHLESGPGVVIKTSYHPVVDPVSGRDEFKIFTGRCKMGVTSGAEVLQHSRCSCRGFFTSLNLAVQRTQRFGFKTTATVFAKGVQF